MREDFVRYDFFYALTEVKKLNPWDIQLENSIDKKSFFQRNNEASKRTENPQMDLVVDKNGLRMCAEFGLFRQNKNEDGNINQTARTVKMLNDMIRLGLESFHAKRNAYFIGVADDKMLGHQLKSKIIGKFPSHYVITKEIISEQLKNKTSAFDDRFLNRFHEMKVSVKSDLIFNEEIRAKKIMRETRIMIWRTSLTEPQTISN